MSVKDNFLKYLPWLLIGLSISYLSISLFLSYLIDILNIDIFGLYSWLSNTYTDPYFWMFMFIEASITEQIQWFYLILIQIIIMSYIIINHRKLSKLAALPWFLLFFGVYLMFLEDRFNIRHMGSKAIGSNLLREDVYSAAWETGFTRSSIELSFYFILGITMIIAFLMILRNNPKKQQAKRFMLMGYLFYGTAAIASATRNIGNWYTVVGTRILGFIISGRELGWTATSSPSFSWKPFGFWFMDHLVEESLELFGVTFLLAAILIYLPLSKYHEE